MGQNFTTGCLLSRFQAPSCEKSIEARRSKNGIGTACYKAFYAQTFPHVDAVYSDALCLTGNPEDAADLVEAAYVRVFVL